jgi:micrococcal nuclease
MPPRLRWAWLSAFLGVLVIAAVLWAPGDRALTGRVARVVDAGTIEVQLPGRLERVRYIGVEPLPPADGAPGAPGPVEINRQLVEGHTVRLELDAQERDGEGRLLAYVYVGGAMVNADLVRLGYARAAPASPNLRHQERLAGLEQEAKAHRRGLWAPPCSGR